MPAARRSQRGACLVLRPIPLLAFLVLWHISPSLAELKAQPSLTPLAPAQSDACSFCMFVLQTLDNIALLNSSIQSAISAVQPICNQLPPSPQVQCQSLVQKNTPIMLKLLLKLETPNLICTALGICNSTNSSPSPTPVPVLTVGNEGNTANNEEDKIEGDVPEDCTLCRYVIATLSAELEDPTTQKKFLTSVADMVCAAVPDSERTACEDLIISQGQTVVFITLKNATPQIVCSPPWLPICPANTTQTP